MREAQGETPERAVLVVLVEIRQLSVVVQVHLSLVAHAVGSAQLVVLVRLFQAVVMDLLLGPPAPFILAVVVEALGKPTVVEMRQTSAQLLALLEIQVVAQAAQVEIQQALERLRGMLLHLERLVVVVAVQFAALVPKAVVAVLVEEGVMLEMRETLGILVLRHHLQQRKIVFLSLGDQVIL